VLERFRRWLRGDRAVALADCDDLAGALALEAGYLCNRVMQDYARMRTGRGWPALFSSPAFQERLDAARDRAAPLCLVWVTRAARLAAHDMLLADAATARERAARFDEVLQREALAALDRLTAAGGEVEDDVRAALEQLAMRPPLDLRAMVSRPGAARFHALLPLDPIDDPDRRQGEEEVLRNLLRLVLAGIHARFSREIDAVGIAGAPENSPISGSPAPC
jgi:hypothetical protein